MKFLATIAILILINSNAEARVFNSIRHGNFDDLTIWDKNEVPIFDEDTIRIHHTILYSRDSIVFGIKQCKKRPVIIVERTGVFCLQNPYHMYSLIIYSYGKMFTLGIEYRGVEHYMYNDTTYHNGRVLLTILGAYYPTRTVTAYRGHMRVSSNYRFDCAQSTAIDTGIYDNKCPKGVFYVDDSIGSDSSIKFWLYSQPYMRFRLNFPDTVLEKYTGDSFIYQSKSKDSFTLKVAMADICDKVYKTSKWYDLRKSSAGKNAILTKESEENFRISIGGNGQLIMKSDKEKIYNFYIYDLSMKKVYEEQFFKETSFERTSYFSKGLYILLIKDQNEIPVWSKKLRFD